MTEAGGWATVPETPARLIRRLRLLATVTATAAAAVVVVAASGGPGAVGPLGMLAVVAVAPLTWVGWRWVMGPAEDFAPRRAAVAGAAVAALALPVASEVLSIWTVVAAALAGRSAEAMAAAAQVVVGPPLLLILGIGEVGWFTMPVGATVAAVLAFVARRAVDRHHGGTRP